MRLLSLFSGIGAFEKAMELDDIPFDIIAYCEIDKEASKAYSLLHGVDESMNLGDITKVDPQDVPPCDIVVHGSPCQSFSQEGNKTGGVRGSGTSSSLLWYSVEIIRAKHPQFIVWENVSAVLYRRNLPVFLNYLRELTDMGYESSFDVINALDVDVPQNRERMYCISRLRND